MDKNKVNILDLGYEIDRFDDHTGLPIKNKLPQELRERLKTKNQWLEEGFEPKENEEGFELVAAAGVNRRAYIYFLDTQVEKIDVSKIRGCISCDCRNEKGFCIVQEEYVGIYQYCHLHSVYGN